MIFLRTVSRFLLLSSIANFVDSLNFDESCTSPMRKLITEAYQDAIALAAEAHEAVQHGSTRMLQRWFGSSNDEMRAFIMRVFSNMNDAELSRITYHCNDLNLGSDGGQCQKKETKAYYILSRHILVICPNVFNPGTTLGKYYGRGMSSVTVDRVGDNINVNMARFLGATLLHEFTHVREVNFDQQSFGIGVDDITSADAQNVASELTRVVQTGITDNRDGNDVYGPYRAQASVAGGASIADSYKYYALETHFTRMRESGFRYQRPQEDGKCLEGGRQTDGSKERCCCCVIL